MNPSTHEPPIIAPPPADPWDALPKRIQDLVLEDHRYDEVEHWDWWEYCYEDFVAAGAIPL